MIENPNSEDHKPGSIDKGLKPEPKIFTKEDKVLYAFTFLLIILASIYFVKVQQKQVSLVEEASSKQIPDDLKLKPNDLMELNFYRSQIYLNNQLIAYSSRGVIATSSIKYIAFLVGMIMIFLGSIMIVRGIKIDTTEMGSDLGDRLKFKMISSSPGILMAFLGATILITSILSGGSVALQNFKIDPYQNGRPSINPNDRFNPSVITPDPPTESDKKFFGND